MVLRQSIAVTMLLASPSVKAAQPRLIQSTINGYFVAPRGVEVSLGMPVEGGPTFATGQLAAQCAKLVKDTPSRTEVSEPLYSVTIRSPEDLNKTRDSPVIETLLRDGLDHIFAGNDVSYSLSVRLTSRIVPSSAFNAAMFEHCCSLADSHCPGRFYVSEIAEAEVEALELSPKRKFFVFPDGEAVRRPSKLPYRYVRLAALPPKEPLSAASITSIGSATFDFGSGNAGHPLSDRLRFRISRSTFHGKIDLVIPDNEFVFAGKISKERSTLLSSRCDRDALTTSEGCDISATLVVTKQLTEARTFRVEATLTDDYGDAPVSAQFNEFLYTQPSTQSRQLSAVLTAGEPLMLGLGAPGKGAKANTIVAVCSPDLPDNGQILPSILDAGTLEVDARCDIADGHSLSLKSSLRCNQDDLHWCSVDVSMLCPNGGPTCVPPPLTKVLIGLSRTDIGAHLVYPLKIVVMGAPAPVVTNPPR